jgi:hypothetical protein
MTDDTPDHPTQAPVREEVESGDLKELPIPFAGPSASAESLAPWVALHGSGVPMTEAREVESFAKIDLGGAFELVVHVDPSAAQRVELSGDDNVVSEVYTRVDDGELEVGIDTRMLNVKTPLKLEVWLPMLTEIDASGASDIEVEGLHGERFELDLSGASESRLTGQVGVFEADLSGAAQLEARHLQAKQVELELSGAGEAQVFASESLEVDVSGAGSVRYWGAPAKVQREISGAGSVEPGTP